ncbi:MAG: hypothetical protein H0W07_00680 [Chloroflexi bacterium]|nr:hypothetical protein [Chloroflexota bacterium]
MTQAGFATQPDPHRGWFRLTIVFAIASFIEAVGFGHFRSFQPLLVRSLGRPEPDVAIVVGLLCRVAAAGSAARPVLGAWSDRYSRKLDRRPERGRGGRALPAGRRRERALADRQGSP